MRTNNAHDNLLITSMVSINKEEIGKHNTNDHKDKMPCLEIATNFRNDVSNGNIKEGSSRKSKCNGHSSLIYMGHPKSC